MSASLDIGEDNEVVCNYKDKDSVGSCVDAGTCGIKPNQYGKTIGKCSAKDHMGQNKDCCSLTVPCGEVSHSLVSYFRNPSWPDSEDKDTTCNIKIVVKPKVCQIRIDFLEFQLASPDKKSGACLSNNNMAIFSHSNPSGLLGGKNHGFCGNNKNQHLYIPCGYHDKINFMTTISKKSQDHHFEYKYDKHWFEEKNYKWNIKITQIPCSSDDKYFSELEAPKGCLQYYYKEHGELKSFNYDEHARLGYNQDYAICIKTVGGHHGLKACSITYKASQFEMPVGGRDVGYCESGMDIVNELTNRECCVDPKSSYLAFVGKQPKYKKYEKKYKKYEKKYKKYEKKYEKKEKHEKEYKKYGKDYKKKEHEKDWKKKEHENKDHEKHEEHEKKKEHEKEHEKHEKKKEHEVEEEEEQQEEQQEVEEEEEQQEEQEEEEQVKKQKEKLFRRHVKYDRKHKEEYEKDKKEVYSKDGSTRRYWCGKSLGPVNEVLSSPKLAILKVFSGKKSEEKLDSPARGFVIDYKIETGYC